MSWDGDGLPELEQLVRRSNLLGADLRVTNFGGGNTSAKLEARDPLSDEPATVLWVKGSGGDLGSIRADGFASLYLDRLHALASRYRGREHEDEMVGLLAHCVFDANPRAPSIDTPLHAFLPYRHVDHTHPDAVIAIAAARESERLTAEIFAGEVGWLPWQRPGFDLALRMRDLVRRQPDLRGIVLAGHGLFSWGATARDGYENTLELVSVAEAAIAARSRGRHPLGEVKHPLRPEAERRRLAASLLPLLRGAIPSTVGHFDDGPDVAGFVASERLEELAALGTSCPDHFLRTKIRPLVLPADPEALERDLPTLLARYRQAYAAYYERCRHPDSPPMRDASPVVLLMPGVGMFTLAADKQTARIAAEFYVNAIRVMRGASALGEYTGLPEQEAFDVEYWALEEAKLRRRPKPCELAGRVALVTGAAGGIGSAVARRLLADDACVMLTDRDEAALESVRAALVEESGTDRIRAVVCDVTSEAEVAAAFARAALEFGGVDIVVSNAGIASAAPIEDTALEAWQRNIDVLATGYFLVAREAARLLKRQAAGGSIVFIGSKNALAASAGASAYSAAKAASLHLARALALELAPSRIRVNVVNPDAVLRGSKIWTGRWREERAAAYGLDPDQLEAHYRERSLLKREVLPEDVAEAVHFFASERSAVSTGNVLNVDAGNAAAFPR